MSSCPDNAEPTPRTTTMLERLVRFGFQHEQILDDRREVEAVVYLRPCDDWRDVVVVYAEQVARPTVDDHHASLNRTRSPSSIRPRCSGRCRSRTQTGSSTPC